MIRSLSEAFRPKQPDTSLVSGSKPKTPTHTLRGASVSDGGVGQSEHWWQGLMGNETMLAFVESKLNSYRQDV